MNRLYIISLLVGVGYPQKITMKYKHHQHILDVFKTSSKSCGTSALHKPTYLPVGCRVTLKCKDSKGGVFQECPKDSGFLEL